MENKISAEKQDNIIFVIVPVEHLVIDAIDRLGDYLLLNVPFFLADEYKIAVELNDYEKELIRVLKRKQQWLESLNELEYCTLFIKQKLDNQEDVETIVFDVERACDFLAITQYRFDRKEWSIGKPGSIGSYLIMFNIDIETGAIDVIHHEYHCFNEIPGIGLEVSFSPLSNEDNFYKILFMDRTDEVYMTCRYYITKACRTFTITSLQSTFNELFATLEGIGMIGCNQFANFTLENKRIMAVNCNSQSEYESNLDTFCYYSETIRTLVLHQGHSLLEYMDRKSTFRLLTSIFYEIINFAANLIKTEIVDLDEIDTFIESRIAKYEDHISSIDTSFLLNNKERKNDGDRDVFIFPIENLVIDQYILLGKLLIIPVGFLSDCINDRNKYAGIEEYYIDKILDDKLIEENNNVVFLLLKGEYQMNQFDTTLNSWQYIDDICAQIQDMLVPLFIQDEALLKRNNCLGIVGVHGGIRGGFVYDSAYNRLVTICGRVYSLINHTKSPLLLEKKNIDETIIDIICSDNRSDEVAIGCKSVLITLGKAMREDEATYMLMDMFDAVDKTNPFEYNIAPKWKWIASFVMDKRSEYDMYHERLKNVGKLYRTPMYHYGKNAGDLFNNKEDIYHLFNEMKEYLFKCVKKMYITGITSWDSMKTYRNSLM